MVEGARLERVCAGNRTVGSNPTLSVRLGRSTGPFDSTLMASLTASRVSQV